MYWMISRKTAKVRYTYEQIASARAQQLGSREESGYLGLNKTENKVLNLIKGNKIYNSIWNCENFEFKWKLCL